MVIEIDDISFRISSLDSFKIWSTFNVLKQIKLWFQRFVEKDNSGLSFEHFTEQKKIVIHSYIFGLAVRYLVRLSNKWSWFESLL
jgi:hypothetical protein